MQIQSLNIGTRAIFVFLLKHYYVHFESMFRLVNHVSGHVLLGVNLQSVFPRLDYLARARGLEAETVSLS